jgi:hypothetical protein
MVAKLAVIIVAIGATFAALLVNRQQRIDAVAEIARAQIRVEAHRKTVLKLHAAVAEAVRPAELRMAIARSGVQWQPIPYRFEPVDQRLRREPITELAMTTVDQPDRR